MANTMTVLLLGVLVATATAGCSASSEPVDGSDAVSEVSMPLMTANECLAKAKDGSVSLCHATGSWENPYELIQVSANACVNGHANHSGDFPSYDPSCTPNCGVTLAGLVIKKGTPCTVDDVQVCNRSCGPNSIGYKPETCTNGFYAEPSGVCNYSPKGDFSCYAIPATLPDAATTCGITSTVLYSNTPCTAPPCTLCNLAGGYADGDGVPKTGYCVCREGVDGARTWTCATSSYWPCPGRPGC